MSDPWTVPFEGWSYPWRERTATVRGHRISYMDAGDGEPLLLCHPVGTGGWFWALNGPVLRERYRVIVPDVIGHGRSAKPDVSYRIGELTAVCCGLLDHLGIAEATWIGNSMGGNIALEAALRRPDLVERLVLEDPGGVQSAPVGPVSMLMRFVEGAIAPRVHRLVFRTAVEASVRVLFVRQPPQIRALVDRVLRWARGDEAGPWLRAVARIVRSIAAEPCRARLREVDAPTLVLWGDTDRLLPPRLGRDLARRIPGARLSLFKRTGHCPHAERPAAWNRLVVRWLKTGMAPGVV